jgi:hypothetical protein
MGWFSSNFEVIVFSDMPRFFPIKRFILRLLALPLCMLVSATGNGQRPQKIGIIDFYGLQNTTEKQAREAIGLKEGDALPDPFNPVAVTDRLRKIPGVKNASVANVCCDMATNGAILFIGIPEKEEIKINYHPAPGGSIQLPPEIGTAYDSVMHYLYEGILKGEADEDRSKGYSLMKYPPARRQQEKFIVYASKYRDILPEVLHKAADPKQRAVAATVIAYGSDKKTIITELMKAIYDSDDAVRNNATRALALIGGYAQANPAESLYIPAAPFISMIRSLVWTDRNKGIAVLTALTESRDVELLALLRKECLPELTEMAKWNSSGHAAFSVLVLARMADVKDEEVFAVVETLEKNKFVDKILEKIRKQ